MSVIRLANALCQRVHLELIHRIREQARSHRLIFLHQVELRLFWLYVHVHTQRQGRHRGHHGSKGTSSRTPSAVIRLTHSCHGLLIAVAQARENIVEGCP